MTDASTNATPGAPAAQAPALVPPPQTTPPPISKLKVDWDDGNAEEYSPEDLISNYKMTRRQAEQLRNQIDPVMQFLQGLQGGDLDSLSHLNIPEDRMLDFAERVLTKKLEFEQMSPQQRAMLQKEQELADRERKFKEWEAEQQKQEQQQISAQALQQVQTDIVDAIKDLGLKGNPSPRLIRRVAEQLKAQIEGQKPMDAKRASKYEWDNIANEMKEYQLMMLEKDPEAFVANLPKEVRKAIREYEIKAGSPFERPKHGQESSSDDDIVHGMDYLEKKYIKQKRRRIH